MKDDTSDGRASNPVPWFVERARRIDAKPTPRAEPVTSDAGLPAFLNDWPSHTRQPLSAVENESAPLKPTKEADHPTPRRSAKLRRAKQGPSVSQKPATQTQTKLAQFARRPLGSMADTLTADHDGVLPMRYPDLPPYASTELSLGDGDQVLERLTDPQIEFPATPVRKRRVAPWVGALAVAAASLLAWTGFENWNRSIETRQAFAPLATSPASSVAVTVPEPAALNEELVGPPAAGSKTAQEPPAQEASAMQVATMLPQRVARPRPAAAKQSRAPEPAASDGVARLPGALAPESQFAAASPTPEALPSQEVAIANNRDFEGDAVSVEQLALLAGEEEAGLPPTSATTPLSKPVRTRTVLPECKGFQVYRPTTPCRIGKPR